ncbi:MAG: leucine-rich repeat domain-containing protein, partial [Clostridia bacterium]|nr:leucine-rich repeat domain-containing protein [Clostridia bacterium]
ERIHGCEAVIMFLSSNIFKKPDSFVHKEWDIAKRRNKKVYLVILDYIDESNIPPRYDFWWGDISSTQSVSALKFDVGTCVDMIIDAVGFRKEIKTIQKSVVYNSDKNDNQDILVADNRVCNVAEFIDQSTTDDFVIEDGVLKKYKGKDSVVKIPYGVTSIGDKAFEFFKSITSIEIPDSVTSIGEEAFRFCSSLISIKIPDSVTSIGNYAFNACYSLKRAVIGNSVTSIGDLAFSNCSVLASVVIGKKVSSIGDSAFQNCSKLIEVINKSSLNITKNSSNYGYAGYYALEIHQGESKIVNQNGYLFYTYDGTNYLLDYVGKDTDLTLPKSYNGQDYEIYQYAFCDCTSLRSIVIPDNISSIADNVFSDCESLTCIVIPNSVTSIGDYAFSGCKSLTSIEIPDSIISIGIGAFSGCKSLTSIEIPDSVTEISSYIFEDCTALTSIEIPYDVFLIDDCAFIGCISLESIIYRGTEEEWNEIEFGDEWISENSNHTLRFEP